MLTPVDPVAPRASLQETLAVDARVLEDVSKHAAEGLFKLRHGGLEVGGVLFGRFEQGRTQITMSRIFEPSYAHGPVYRLSAQDLSRLRELLRAPESDPELAGCEPVGWYVSHTRSDLAFNAWDEEVFHDCFPLLAQVTLVLKPAKFDPSRAIFYGRDAAGALTEGQEFRIEQQADPVNAEVPPKPPGPEPARGPEPAVVLAQPPPEPEHHRPRFRTALLAGAGALVCGSLLGALLYTTVSRRAAPAAKSPPVRARIEIPQDSPKPERPPDVVTAQPAATAESSNTRVQELERELAELRSQLSAGNKPDAQKAAPADPPLAQKVPPRKFSPPASDTAERRAAPAAGIYVPPPPTEFGATASPVAATALLSSSPAVAPPPVTLASNANARGRLIWTGTLPKGGLLFIEGGRPSSGTISGSLPGGPVRCTLQTGELTAGGMLIYTSNSRLAGRSEPPGPSNGWNHAIYEHDPKRLADVDLLEAPASANGWKKLVMRGKKRPVNMILIDWESVTAPSQRADNHASSQTR